MAWLRDTPGAVVAAHLVMMPRLDAEKALAAAAIAGRTDGFEKLHGIWKREAAGGREQVRRMSPGDFGGMGIGVKLAPRRQP